MPSTGVILPDGDGTIDAGITHFDGSTTTNQWDEINEDPDSSPNDSDGIEFADDSNLNGGFFTLGAMPGDFVTMVSCELEVRVARRDSGGDDTFQITADVRESDESARLSNATAPQTIPTGTTFVNYTFTLSGVIAGSAAQWNGARIEIEQRWNQNKGEDGNALRCSAAKLTGIYSDTEGTRRVFVV